jgi:hypothetical protein
MWLPKIEKLPHNDQNEDITYRMGENLCSYSSGMGVISRIYKELKK